MRKKTHSRGIWVGRISFLTTLACVAVLLGVLAKRMLIGAEETLAIQQFKSIASRAVVNVRLIVERKIHGVKAMAKIAANVNPNAAEWPFVYIQGFEEIASELKLASNGRGMGFGPLVQPEDLPSFEDFAYTYYNSTRKPEPFPIGAGVQHFGKGLWGRNSEGIYHDNEVERTYETDFDYFAPVLHQDISQGTVLMFNLRSEETRGKTLDRMVQCSLDGKAVCDQITDILTLVTNGRGSPAALLIAPVLPTLNQSSFPSGFVASSMVFFDVFENVFGETVDGILCVLQTADHSIEFLVEKGQSVRIVNGEFAKLQGRFRDIRAQATLTSDKLVAGGSPIYKLALYPTQQFFDVYSTGNSLLASLGSVIIIVLTGLLFMVYDFFVRREFSHKSELLETKRNFMRFVCHEVRTPMNSVCLGLSLIQEEMESAIESGVVADNIRNWTDLSLEIHQSAQRAIDVLSDLLNYDKIEQGKFKLELSVLSTSEVVERTSSEFNLEAKRRGLNCTINMNTGSECVLVGDKLRLTQVIRNLLSNALKFTPEGGDVTISVQELVDSTSKKAVPTIEKTLHCGTVAFVAAVGKAVISVADSGVGMSQSQIEGLFMDGVQFNVNTLQAGKGSGIGLFIARGIVEQHEGFLSCTSSGLGEGCVFTLELPLYKLVEVGKESCSEDSGAVTEKETPSATTVVRMERTSDPLNFLVIDDSATNRKLLIRLLEKEGHMCKEASDGQEAVDMFKEGMLDFDVILLDFEMPVLNGPDAASIIRSLGCTTLIIGITGNALLEDIQYFKDKGADEVLAKPVRVNQIEAVIARFGIQGNVSQV